MKKYTLFERLHFLHRIWRYKNRTEPDTVRFIRDFVKKDGVVLDIGANKGIVSWFLCKAVGINGRVLSFEPQPELIPVLEGLKTTFGLEGLTIFNIGLAETLGTKTLFRACSGSTGNMVASAGGSDELLSVEVTTLDHFLNQIGLPDINFIKCDVDGFEDKVLMGSSETLKRCKPALLIEISQCDLDRIREYLALFGYSNCCFMFKNKIHPAKLSGELPFRHKNAPYRNFLFIHDNDLRLRGF
jgi:FkbM family methyltransferase